MTQAVHTTQPAQAGSRWAPVMFRWARVCLLALLAVIAIGSITALHEGLLLLCAVLLAAHLLTQRRVRLRPTPLLLPLLLYLLAALASLIYAVDWTYSLDQVRGEVLKGILAFYLGVHFVGHPRHLTQAWAALLIGVAAMSAFALSLPLSQKAMAYYWVRASSLSDDYPFFATYLVLTWPFVLLAGRLFRRPGQGRGWGWILAALIPLAGAAAYLTQSRAAWLAMVLQTGLCLVLLSRRRLLAAAGGLALCLGLAAVLLSLPGFSHGERWSRLLNQPGQVGGTAGDLAEVMSFSLEQIRRHPFQGIGLGRDSFAKAYPEFMEHHQPMLWHSHNMFLASALQMGLQGLAALLLVLVVLLVCLWPRSPPKAGDPAALWMTAAVLAVVGFCLRNLSDNLFVDDTAILFWLLSGLALGGRWLVREGQTG